MRIIILTQLLLKQTYAFNHSKYDSYLYLYMLEHLTLILLPQHQCNKKAFLHKHLASNWYKTNLRQTDA